MGYGTVRRMRELDSMIRTARLHSVEHAAAELEVSSRTIERDIREMKESLGAEVVYDRQLRRYRYEGEPLTLPATWLNEKEIALLLIAERALREFVGSSFHKEIHPTFNRLLAPIRGNKKAMQYARHLARAVDFHVAHKQDARVQQAFSTFLDAALTWIPTRPFLEFDRPPIFRTSPMNPLKPQPC